MRIGTLGLFAPTTYYHTRTNIDSKISIAADPWRKKRGTNHRRWFFSSKFPIDQWRGEKTRNGGQSRRRSSLHFAGDGGRSHGTPEEESRRKRARAKERDSYINFIFLRYIWRNTNTFDIYSCLPVRPSPPYEPQPHRPITPLPLPREPRGTTPPTPA